jgi:hypothetical protein
VILLLLLLLHRRHLVHRVEEFHQRMPNLNQVINRNDMSRKNFSRETLRLQDSERVRKYEGGERERRSSPCIDRPSSTIIRNPISSIFKVAR